MDDQSLVAQLLAIGVAARRKDPDAYATPSDHPNLKAIGPATIAFWLEELGRHRLVDDVQPCFTSSGAGFRFKVTDEAVRLSSDASQLAGWLNKLIPRTPTLMCSSATLPGIQESPMSFGATWSRTA